MPAGGLILSSSKHKSALSIYACGCRWKSYYENYICHCPLELSKLVFEFWKMINGRFLILESLSMPCTVSTGLDASEKD